LHYSLAPFEGRTARVTDFDVIDGPSFVKGDTDTDHDYPITRSRSVLDLTGYTGVEMEGWNETTGEALATLVGSILAPASNGVVRFNHDTIAAAVGVYRCQIVLVSVAGRRRLKRDIRIPVRESVEDMT
jgi:hypothetical protein